MPALASGASVAVTLASGDRLAIVGGAGQAVLGPGPQAGAIFPLTGETSIGPFPRAQSVYLTANAAMDYQAYTPTPSNAVLTARQIIAGYVADGVLAGTVAANNADGAPDGTRYLQVS